MILLHLKYEYKFLLALTCTTIFKLKMTFIQIITFFSFNKVPNKIKVLINTKSSISFNLKDIMSFFYRIKLNIIYSFFCK